MEAVKHGTARSDVGVVPRDIPAPEFCRMVPLPIGPSIRNLFDSVAWPRCIHLVFVEYWNLRILVIVDFDHLVGSVSFHLKFRMGRADVINHGIEGRELCVAIVRKLVERLLQVFIFTIWISALLNGLAAVLLFGSNLIGILLFDLPALILVGILRIQLIDVISAEQEAHL